jgi:TP901 family phage tail tape measure protein
MADTPAAPVAANGNGNGNGGTRKTIRLDVNSANPNLQGIRQTIRALNDLNGVLRRVNQQAGLLGRQTGFDIGSLGKRPAAAAAEIAKATGVIASNTAKAEAAIRKFHQLPPVPQAGRLYSEQRSFADEGAMQRNQPHRIVRDFRPAPGERVQSVTTEKGTSFRTTQSPGKVRDKEWRDARAEQMRQFRLEAKQLEDEARNAKTLSEQKEKMWQAQAKRDQAQELRNQAATEKSIGANDERLIKERESKSKKIDKANREAEQRVLADRARQAQKSEENRKRIESIPARERDAGIAAQAQMDAELNARAKAARQERINKHDADIKRKMLDAESKHREAMKYLGTQRKSGAVLPGIYQARIDAEKRWLSQLEGFTKRLSHDSAVRETMATRRRQTNERIASSRAALGGTPPPIPPQGGFMQNLQGGSGRWLGRGTQGWTPGGMARNAVTVGGWMNAVSVWFAAMNLIRYSLQRMEDIQLQTARLTQVFRSGGGSAKQLADDVLKLAAAEGRGTEEAMASSIAWSRLGLTRKQVAEATRVSLVGANVAEVSADDATQRMASVMASYGLQVNELDGVLGMLNQSSNTYRVTVKDMMDGLSRVSSVARQAGMSLAELSGLIAVSVQRTGQTGTNMANALKTVLTRMNRSDVNQFFGSRFDMDIDGTVESLRKVWEAYSAANDEQRQDMMLKLGGATQANRFRAFMESYAESIMAASNALQHLNSAEEENRRITNTSAAARKRVQASWDRFANNAGPSSLIAGGLNMGAGIISGLANAPFPSMNQKPQYFDPSKADFLTALETIGSPAKYFLPTYKQRLGFSNTPSTTDDKFSVETRRINNAAAAAEDYGMREKHYRGLAKTFAGSRPDAQQNILDSLEGNVDRKVIDGMRAGDMSGLVAEAEKMLKLKREQDAIAKREREASIKRIELDKASTRDVAKVVEYDAQIAELTRQNTVQMQEAADEAQRAGTSIERMSEAAARFKGLMQDSAGVIKSFGGSGRGSEIAMLENQIAITQEMLKGEKDEDINEKLSSELRDMEAQLSYLRSGASQFFADSQTRSGIAGQMAKFETDAMGVGGNEGERLLDRRNKLQAQYNALASKTKLTLDEGIRAEVIAQQLKETHLTIAKRLLEVDQQREQVQADMNKEFKRSLIGAGPGDLLRKMATAHLADKGGMNAGAFFAMSPDAQRDAYQLRGGDRMADLNAEAKALGGSKKSVTELQDIALNIDKFSLKIAEAMSKGFNDAVINTKTVVINSASTSQPQGPPEPTNMDADAEKQKKHKRDIRKAEARAKFDEDQKNLPLVDRAVISATRAAGAVGGMLKDLPLRKKVEAGANRFMDDWQARLPGRSEYLLNQNPKNAELDFANPKRSLWFSQMPGARELFNEVRSTTAEAYGRTDGGQGVKMPSRAWIFGKRNESYANPGSYDVDVNRLKVSAKTFEDFATGRQRGDTKAYENARQTIAHELTHYLQDMFSGDVKNVGKLGGTKGAADRLKSQGLSPENDGSSSRAGDAASKNAEEVAEMVAAKVRGNAKTSLNQTVPDAVSVASDAAAKALNGLGSSAVFASRQLDAFAARLQSAFPAMAALAPSAPLPPQSARRR